MIRLCSGSVFKTISLAKVNNHPSDDDLAELLYPYANLHANFIRQVKSCDKNLPLYISSELRKQAFGSSPNTIVGNTEEALKRIPRGNHEAITLTLLDIIRNDSNLKPTVYLGLTGSYTKQSLNGIQELYLPDFLANLIIYAAIAADNAQGKDGIKELNKEYFESFKQRNASITLLDSPSTVTSTVSAVIKTDTNTCKLYLDPDFDRYMNDQFETYKQRNIAVYTPQLLSMALKYPNNRALRIFNAFAMDGSKELYGDYLLRYLEGVDKYYMKKGILYQDDQYSAYQKLIRDGIKNSSDLLKYEDAISPTMFCYFILAYSGGSTARKIKEHLGDDYKTAVSFIRDNRVPSIPAYL